MNFQWYPGHMTKAKRMMQEDIKLVDLVIELVDARLPLSSRNPDIDTLGQNKSRLILLNKADLADKRANRLWTEYFKNQGCFVLEVNSRDNAGIKNVNDVVQQACREKIERDRKRGIINRPVRAMVVGIPNVGKSTFINTYAKKACAKTGNKPGVTKGKQWIKLNKNLELLDTPGILWPKFEDQKVGLRLAFVGSINDEILNLTELSMELIKFLEKNYPNVISERYFSEKNQDTTKQEENTNQEPEVVQENAGDREYATQHEYATEQEPATEQELTTKQVLDILEEIAKKRHCVAKGGEYDIDKAAKILLEDFRSGKLGRITLELPE